jgi:predicted acetyltransferase
VSDDVEASRLALRWPRPDEEREFERARLSSAGMPSFLHYYTAGMDYCRYLDVLTEQDKGMALPTPQHVASTFLFAFVAGRIVGRVSIRHALTPLLERVGGHIGYAVLPEFRRRGYATEILRLALPIARVKGGNLRRVLVTCDDDNVASIRVIEKNGGVLENVVNAPELDTPKRRYWIDVS